jgi:hypothetical protein
MHQQRVSWGTYQDSMCRREWDEWHCNVRPEGPRGGVQTVALWAWHGGAGCGFVPPCARLLCHHIPSCRSPVHPLPPLAFPNHQKVRWLHAPCLPLARRRHRRALRLLVQAHSNNVVVVAAGASATSFLCFLDLDMAFDDATFVDIWAPDVRCSAASNNAFRCVLAVNRVSAQNARAHAVWVSRAACSWPLCNSFAPRRPHRPGPVPLPVSTTSCCGAST